MMDHSSLDVWPPHKEVIVPNEPEQILEAINDRGITRLLVEDVLPLPANFFRDGLQRGAENCQCDGVFLDRTCQSCRHQHQQQTSC